MRWISLLHSVLIHFHLQAMQQNNLSAGQKKTKKIAAENKWLKEAQLCALLECQKVSAYICFSVCRCLFIININNQLRGLSLLPPPHDPNPLFKWWNCNFTCHKRTKQYSSHFAWVICAPDKMNNCVSLKDSISQTKDRRENSLKPKQFIRDYNFHLVTNIIDVWRHSLHTSLSVCVDSLTSGANGKLCIANRVLSSFRAIIAKCVGWSQNPLLYCSTITLNANSNVLRFILSFCIKNGTTLALITANWVAYLLAYKNFEFN